MFVSILGCFGDVFEVLKFLVSEVFQFARHQISLIRLSILRYILLQGAAIVEGRFHL